MKILFICSAHALDDERVTRKQAVSLAKFGHEVTVCARKRYDYDEQAVCLVDTDRLLAATKKRNGLAEKSIRFNRLRRIPVLYKYANNFKPDLIVAHELETAMLAYSLRKLHGIPYVFDSHECWEESVKTAVPWLFKSMAKFFAVQCLKIIAKNAEAVTVVSPATESFFKKQSPRTPVKILHNSPILEYFPYSDVKTSPLTIVHEGTLGRERGILQILQALSLVREKSDFKFLILGTIPKDVVTEFNREVERLDLKSLIESPGRLPWTEFGEVEATGQIGLICSQPIPNHMLSLSNKLYSYMACGLAVIGMNGSETERLLTKYHCGISCDATRPKEIAKAIIYLIDNPEERTKMAQNGRKAIEQALGWHCMEERMKVLYSSIENKIKKTDTTSISST